MWETTPLKHVMKFGQILEQKWNTGIIPGNLTSKPPLPTYCTEVGGYSDTLLECKTSQYK